jgi:hypothetical protein
VATEGLGIETWGAASQGGKGRSGLYIEERE